MKQDVVAKLKNSQWQPTTYTWGDLTELLGITSIRAYRIIKDIKGKTNVLLDEWVSHHDLVFYLSDLTSISQVPEHPEEVPKPGLWLMSKKWKIDAQYKQYRWIDPQDPSTHYNLKSALLIELERNRQTKVEDLNRTISEPEDEIIDAEFEAKE